MNLHELYPYPEERAKVKRLGRGTASGQGGTSGKGHKGQNARSGGKVRSGFEGGQMPLYMRLPKHGFTNIHGKDLVTVTLGRLQQAIDSKLIDAKDTIDAASLLKAKVISNKRDGIRLVATGVLKSKITIKVSGASAAATAAIEKAGGSVEVVKIVPKPVVRKTPIK